MSLSCLVFTAFLSIWDHVIVNVSAYIVVGLHILCVCVCVCLGNLEPAQRNFLHSPHIVQTNNESTGQDRNTPHPSGSLWGTISTSRSKGHRDDLTGNESSSHTHCRKLHINRSLCPELCRDILYFVKQVTVFREMSLPVGSTYILWRCILLIFFCPSRHSDLYSNDNIKVVREHENKWNHPSVFIISAFPRLTEGNH